MTSTSQIEEPQGNWKLFFFTIWSGQQISLIGSMLAGFALVWWVTKSTGSATMLAMMTLAQMLPGVLLGPFVGALVDRWNRRVVMIVADSAIALFSAWLAYLFWIDALQMWHIYVITVARAIGGTFHWPAMSASTSLMVPHKHLSRVAGLNQTMQGVVNVISPPLGALLVSLLPFYSIMAIDVVTAAFAVVPLFFVHVPQPERKAAIVGAGGGRPSLWQDVREGLLYVWHWPGVLAMLIMAMLINLLLTPAFSLIPILVTRYFGGAALELGWMNSAWGIGAVAGGLILSAWGGFKRRIVTTLLGLIGMGLAALLVGLSPATAFGLALGATFVLGFMNPLTNGPAFAILQSAVAPEMQGRAFTLVGSLSAAMAPLGMAIAGPVADAFGVSAWFIAGGALCVLMGGIGFATPAVMHLEDNHRQPAVAESRVPAAASE